MKPVFRAFGSVDLRSRVTSRHQNVSWLELFFDLVFAAAISQIGKPFAEDYSPSGLFRYAFMFLLIWWAWLGHTMYSTRFENDDLLHRLLTLLQMFAATVMAANARDSLASRDSAGFVAAYSLIRFLQALQYLRARRIPETRGLAGIYAAGSAGAGLLWLVSAIAPAPARFWIWGIAFIVEFGTPVLASSHARKLPPDAAHLPERFGLFTIILLGEAVAAVMRGIEGQPSWTITTVSSAMISVALPFTYWWWYFEAAAAAKVRFLFSPTQKRAFHLWSYTHFLLYLGIAATGVGLEHLITMSSSAIDEETALMIALAVIMVLLSLALIGATSGEDPLGQAACKRCMRQLLVPAAAILLCLSPEVRSSSSLLAGSLLALSAIGVTMLYRDNSVPQKALIAPVPRSS